MYRFSTTYDLYFFFYVISYNTLLVQKSGMPYGIKSSQYVFHVIPLVWDNMSRMRCEMFFRDTHQNAKRTTNFQCHFKSYGHFPLNVTRTIMNDFIKMVN